MESATLEEVKEIRKKLGLTQTDLARISGVSQSLIAKIESKKIDPTFSKIKKIFEALNQINKKNSLKAKDVMNKKIISVKAKDSIKDVIKKMREHEISQMPVIGKEVKGIITEKSILSQIEQGKNIKEMTAEDVMSDTPPILSEESDIALITNMLKYHQIILISNYGKLTGVITRSDLLRKAYK